MTLKNSFLLPDESYERDLNIIDGYRVDAAKYLQLQTGKSFEECLEFVTETVKPDSEHGLRNPKALILAKNEHQDRQPVTSTFMDFLTKVQNENLQLSPSMAAYLPPHVRQSTHALYIKEGVDLRSKVKGEMFDAERAGNRELALIKDGEQNNYKINNNSYSGATVSAATILYYKSTHSSLTSTCRTATSYANAANEKFIMGNRHYYNPEITKANLVSLITNADLDAIRNTCEMFGIKYPTVNEVMECVEYSTSLYWRGEEQMDLIRRMVMGMSEVERAAVMYVNDLYHLHKLNPDFVIGFLLELSQVASPENPISDEEYKGYDDDVKMLATFLCFTEVAGRDLRELMSSEPTVYHRVKNTARRVMEVLDKYKAMISCFWLTRSIPSSVHAFPDAYRKAVVVSDTDSTMFTLQYWVEQCFGSISFSDDAKRAVFGIVFLISELLMHILAIQSANMGVVKDKLRLLAMKNEFYFGVLSMTTRSKHYYASQDAREGVMFPEAKMEVKGVGLRDSKVPKKINDGARSLMVEIINTIKDGKLLNMSDILKRVADIEREIIASIEAGSPEYMTSGQVKARDSYKNADNPTYMQYELWRDVFAPYLGETREPPYSVVKVSLLANNRTEVEAWCERMENPPLANALREWMHQKKRKDLGTLLIPSTVVETAGIPKEIIAGIDTRKIISNTMGVYYLMLEPLGIFTQDKRISRLLSDIY